MSGIYEDKNRQVMPRWYPFITACQLGDVQTETAQEKPKIQTPIAFDLKVNDWREKRTISHAIELVGTALIGGDFQNLDANEAATFVIGSQDHVSFLGRQIAEVYKSDRNIHHVNDVEFNAEDLPHQFEIARLKTLVRRYPRNAIAWADLAFHYTLLGQNQQAHHCMDIAVSLGGDNRFILRSAARCFLHLDEADKSLFYLRRSSLSKVDPWLASAEISISEAIGKKTRLVKPGKAMIKDGNYSSWSINELAATLSTLEMRHGSMRKSKKLLSTALQQPNENTMAQAEWLASRLGQEVSKPQTEVLATYEADARRSFRDAEYRQALVHAKEWFRFQPFTSRPAILASYIAAVCLQDEQEAIAIVEEAKATSPESFLLHNNHAFSLASLNRIEDAEKVLSRIHESKIMDVDQNTLAATEGLLKFRKGDISEGREQYKRAIAGFKKNKNNHGVTIATLFWAREESLIHSNFESDALKEAKGLAEKYQVKEMIQYADSLAGKK
jgi:tetratricopeptide (TPR) repeat protein